MDVCFGLLFEDLLNLDYEKFVVNNFCMSNVIIKMCRS